jgi:hypothetical protein
VKKIIQLLLILFLILNVAIFYIFFHKKAENLNANTFDQIQTTKNNIVENLKYNIKINENETYEISSKISEIIYENNIETILMKDVFAKLVDKNNKVLTIKSDEALYNNSNYNTIFKKNLNINYLDNKISSNMMTVNFTENLISIIDNVKFEGPIGYLDADYINIDLLEKKINISMNDLNQNIFITSN